MKKISLLLFCVGAAISAVAGNGGMGAKGDLNRLVKDVTPLASETHRLERGTLNVPAPKKVEGIMKAASKARKKAAAEAETRVVTVNMSSLGLSNAQQVGGQSLNLGDVSVLFETNTGTTIPAYYNLGAAIRLYSGNKVTFSANDETTQIVNVNFIFSDGYSWTSSPYVSNGAYDLASQAWAGYANEFYVLSNAKVRLQALEVTYKVVNGTPDEEAEFRYMGTGTYLDGMLEPTAWEVDFYSSQDEPGVYVIADPYGCETSPYYYNAISDENFIASDMAFALFSDGLAASDQFYTGLMMQDDETGEILRLVLISRPYFELRYGSGEAPEDPAMYGSFDNGLITFGSGSMVLLEVTESGNFSAYTFKSDFKIAFPGTDIYQETEMSERIYVGGFGDGLSNYLEELLAVDKSADGKFSFDVDNLESLIISTANESLESFVANSIGCSNVYGSTLGMDMQLFPSTNYMNLPWKGNYHVEVSGDLSTIKFTTASSRPESVDLYLLGDFNGWESSVPYKFTFNSTGNYSYEIAEDLEGQWKVASPGWLYDYGFNGAVNPSGEYEFEYASYNSSLPLEKGDVIKILIDEDLYTESAALTIVKNSQKEDEQPEEVESKEVTIDDIVYMTYPEAGTFSLIDGSKAKGNVTLPQTMQDGGKTLTLSSISTNAFASNSQITGVVIPEGVTVINSGAFSACDYLQDVVLSGSLNTIGEYAFAFCEALSEVSLPASVESVGVGVFAGCTDLAKLDLKSTALTEIPVAFVSDCTRLTEVELPETVTVIGMSAFYNSGVVTVGSSKNVTVVSGNAFGNSKLAEFEFGENLETIGTGAFAGTSLKSVELPESVTRIGEEAFRNCLSLADVTLPATLVKIEKATFENCQSLHLIEIPESVETIDERAFFNAGLVTVTVPDKVTTVGSSALVSPTLMSVTVGEGINSFANLPVSTKGMLRLKTSVPPVLSSQRLGCEPAIVIVPTGSGDAYKAVNRWKGYNIIEENGAPAYVKVSEAGTLAQEIRTQTGKMPAQITNLTVEGELNSTDFAVMRSNMTACLELNLSAVTNTEIPAGAFKGKVSLTKMTLPSALETIGDNAFADCHLMTVCSIPSTVRVIGESAFENCASLSGNLVLPATCEELGARAFAGCYALLSADMSATDLETVEEGAFENAVSLRTVKFSDATRTIEANAFCNAGINSLELPVALNVIGASAFEKCALLPGLTLPESVMSVGTRAFAESGVTYVDFPTGLTCIEDETLADCRDLLVVNLPAQLKELGSRALASSTIASINSPAESPAVTGQKPFENVDNYTCGVAIPRNSFTQYLTAEYWGAFVDLRNNIDMTFDEGVEVTYIDEIDYQEIIGSGSFVSAPRKAALEKLSKDGKVARNYGYGRLFDGAQLYRNDDSRTRFFFNVPEKTEVFRVIYDNEDVTAKIDKVNNSFVTPPFSRNAELKVLIGKSGIENVSADSETSTGIYNLQGIKIDSPLENLPAGIYIVDGKKISVK